jgi:hypothetical protein
VPSRSLKKKRSALSNSKSGFLSSPKELRQLAMMETELMQTVDDIRARNRIFQKNPTFDELLEPHGVEICFQSYYERKVVRS